MKRNNAYEANEIHPDDSELRDNGVGMTLMVHSGDDSSRQNLLGLTTLNLKALEETFKEHGPGPEDLSIVHEASLETLRSLPEEYDESYVFMRNAPVGVQAP